MAKVAKNLSGKLARRPGVKKAVKAVAQQILTNAKARAAAHNDSGTYADSLHLERGRTDVRIVSDDPQGVSKEYGHRDKKTGREVPGVHAITGALADVASRR